MATIIITSKNNTHFNFKIGNIVRDEPRKYRAEETVSGKVVVEVVDEDSNNLFNPIHFSEIEIDGMVYNNVNDCINAINSIVYQQGLGTSSLSNTIPQTTSEFVCETYTDGNGKIQKRTLTRTRHFDSNSNQTVVRYYNGETLVKPDLTKIETGSCDCDCIKDLAPINYQGDLFLTTSTGQSYQSIIPNIQEGESAGFGGTVKNELNDDILVNIGYINNGEVVFKTPIKVLTGDTFVMPDSFYASVEIQVIDNQNNPINATSDGRVHFYSTYTPENEECIVLVPVIPPRLLKGFVYYEEAYASSGAASGAEGGSVPLFFDQNFGGPDVVYNIEVIQNDYDLRNDISTLSQPTYHVPKTTVSIPTNGVVTIFDLFERNPNFVSFSATDPFERTEFLMSTTQSPVTPVTPYPYPYLGYKMAILRLTTTDTRVSNDALDVVFYEFGAV